jgi:seryl-tRNA synthetase
MKIVFHSLIPLLITLSADTNCMLLNKMGMVHKKRALHAKQLSKMRKSSDNQRQLFSQISKLCQEQTTLHQELDNVSEYLKKLSYRMEALESCHTFLLQNDHCNECVSIQQTRPKSCNSYICRHNMHYFNDSE